MTTSVAALCAAAPPPPSPVFSADFTDLDGLPDGVTHTRAGHAMYYDSTGKLTYAPNNLQLHTATFSGWPTNATTLTTGQTDPFGGTTAVLMTGTGTDFSALHGYSLYTGAVIVSFYVKAGTQTKCELWDAGGFSMAKYDLSAVSATPTSGDNGADSAGIADVGGGWFRIWYKKSSPTYAAYPRIIQGWDGLVGTTTLYVAAPQQEAVTYETTPRPYVATTSAAYYGPRIDYDPATLSRKGLLTEGAATNLAPYSRFNNMAGSWPVSSTQGYAYDVAIGPDGLQQMARFYETTGTSGHGIYQPNATTVANTDYCGSVYVKGINRTKVRVSIVGSGASTGVYAEFDLSNKTVLTQATAFNGATAASNSAKIQDVGGGIFRLSVAGKYNDTNVYVIISSLDDSGNYSFAGDSNKGLYVGYVQVELGVRATSFVPTGGGSPVARAKDIYTLSVNGLTSNFTQLVSATFNDNRVQDVEYLHGKSLSDNDVSETLGSDGLLSAWAYPVGYSSHTVETDATFTEGEAFTAVNSYSSNAVGFAVNGAFKSLSIPSAVRAPAVFYIGNYSEGSYNANAHIRKVAIYDQTLSQADVTALSQQ